MNHAIGTLGPISYDNAIQNFIWRQSHISVPSRDREAQRLNIGVRWLTRY